MFNLINTPEPESWRRKAGAWVSVVVLQADCLDLLTEKLSSAA